MTDRVSQATDLPVREALRGYRRDTYIRCASSATASGPGSEPDDDTLDCASGVFEFEPSTLVAQALRGFDVKRLASYTPAAVESRLKTAILDRFHTPGLAPEQLFLGHGSFNLLERIIHKFLKPLALAGIGPQFSEVPSEFIAAGGCYQSFPLTGPDASLPLIAMEKVLAAGGWSAVYVDNPNNPLGRAFPPDAVARLADVCDETGTVLVVDEAFGDYVDDTASAIHLVPRQRNLIVVRSFSKALGLAAERVGYVFLSAGLARRYREIDVPFEPGIVAQTLATETLRDPEWIDRVRLDVRQAKSEIVAALQGTGVRVLPTHPDVAIMALHQPGRDLWRELRQLGVRALPGSAYKRTHPDWDDSYCRLRVMRGDQLGLLCRRLAGL